MQALGICRAATEARHAWRIRFLETLFTHDDRVSRKATVLAKLKEVGGKKKNLHRCQVRQRRRQIESRERTLGIEHRAVGTNQTILHRHRHVATQ